jgi:hypothetical protein
MLESPELEDKRGPEIQAGDQSVASEKMTKKTVREWVRPEVRKMSAGSAETNATGIDDGGPVGNARS